MSDENLFENLDEETRKKIQEAQILEQSFQQLLIQKQAFQHELNETDFALKELDKSEGDVFKVVGGQIMLKTSKEKLAQELNDKKKLIELRIKNIDKQEKEFSDKLDSLRNEIMKKISPQTFKDGEEEE